MKNVKLQKASEKGATFNVFNEAKQNCGILICMFISETECKWMKTGTIPEGFSENCSEYEIEARLAVQNTQ